MLKYTKESFSLNIQTNNITWDLWRYVAGILHAVGLGMIKKEQKQMMRMAMMMIDHDDNADAEDN